MNKLSPVSFGLLLSVSMALFGCGGGGSSSGSNPPVNQSSSPTLSSVVSSRAVSAAAVSSQAMTSAAASSITATSAAASSLALSSATASSVQTTTQLTIKGTAVADALVGGEVSVVIDSETFTATVNEQGQYQILLDAAKDSNKPLVAIAKGVASNDWVEMAALYPSITKLRELAGSDGILDASEYPGVNISPFTTAEYSIIVGNRLALATDEDRKYALFQVGAGDKLKRAAYLIKHLTDIDAELSPKHETTLDLLLDKIYVGGQLNINREYNDHLESELSALKADRLQTSVSNKKMVGKFLLRADSFTYMLTLDETGSGLLLTSNSPGMNIWASNGKYQQKFFTWIRKGNNIQINLESPIEYGKTLGYGNTSPIQCADLSSGISVAVCPVTLDGFRIALIDENEVGKIAEVQLDARVSDANGNTVFDGAAVTHFAALLDVSKLYKISKEELQGATWVSNNYSYSFNADGTATQINSYDKNEITLHWQLDDGRVVMDGDALEILPLYPQGPGFVVMQLLLDTFPSAVNGAYAPTSFIKRDNTSMTLADWVGRWNREFENSFSSASDFFENGQFRDGFETQQMGSWVAMSPTHISGRSNGAWRMEYELLAIKDGQYYMQNCSGMNSDNFIPRSCAVESYVIDKAFTGNILWETWSNPLFQNEGSGEYWQFWGHELYAYNSGAYRHQSFVKVSRNLFLDRWNGKILEMLSSDVNSLELCEYDVFGLCDESKIFRLKRTPEIKFVISGAGSVYYDSREFNATGSMMVRKETKSIQVQPALGQQLLGSNIQGCDGVLNGIYYDIPAPQADCEIAVTFTPIP